MMTIAEQFNLAFQFMLLGMGVVFTFLTVLVLVVKWTGDIIQKIEAKQFSAEVTEPSDNEPLVTEDQEVLTAVIGATIHQYRKQHISG